MNVTYKGKKYKLEIGSRGGHFFIDSDGKKHYIKKKKEAMKKVTSSSKPFSFKSPQKYVCYYKQRDKNGEIVDDFKEWTTASSEDEARRHFENEYSHNPLIEIDMIIQSK